MTAITAAGYMIQDKNGYAIYGVGETVDQAWAQVVAEDGTFFDAYGNEKKDERAFTEDFKTYPATDALIAKVEEEGGCIIWSIINGVACTKEEADY